MPRLGSRVRIPSSAPNFFFSYFPLSPGKTSHSPDFLHHPSRERTQLHIQSHSKLNLTVYVTRHFAASHGEREWSCSGHAFCTFCTCKAQDYSPLPLFSSVYGACAKCGHASGHAHTVLPSEAFLGNCNLAQRCARPVRIKFFVMYVAQLVTPSSHVRTLLPRFDFIYILLLTFIMFARSPDQGGCLAISPYAILFSGDRRDCCNAQGCVRSRRRGPDTWSCLWS